MSQYTETLTEYLNIRSTAEANARQEIATIRARIDTLNAAMNTATQGGNNEAYVAAVHEKDFLSARVEYLMHLDTNLEGLPTSEELSALIAEMTATRNASRKTLCEQLLTALAGSQSIIEDLRALDNGYKSDLSLAMRVGADPAVHCQTRQYEHYTNYANWDALLNELNGYAR